MKRAALTLLGGLAALFFVSPVQAWEWWGQGDSNYVSQDPAEAMTLRMAAVYPDAQYTCHVTGLNAAGDYAYGECTNPFGGNRTTNAILKFCNYDTDPVTYACLEPADCTGYDSINISRSGSGSAPGSLCIDGCYFSRTGVSVEAAGGWVSSFTGTTTACFTDPEGDDPGPDPDGCYTAPWGDIICPSDVPTECGQINDQELCAAGGGCGYVNGEFMCPESPQNCGYYNGEWVCVQSPSEPGGKWSMTNTSGDTTNFGDNVTETTDTTTTTNPDGSTTTTSITTNNYSPGTTTTTTTTSADGTSSSTTTSEVDGGAEGTDEAEEEGEEAFAGPGNLDGEQKSKYVSESGIDSFISGVTNGDGTPGDGLPGEAAIAGKLGLSGAGGACSGFAWSYHGHTGTWDAHCGPWDTWGRDALGWLFVALTAIYIFHLGSVTIREGQ